jgi:hypothetical protein
MGKPIQTCMPYPQEDSIQLGARQNTISLGNRHNRGTGENYDERPPEDADMKPPGV